MRLVSALVALALCLGWPVAATAAPVPGGAATSKWTRLRTPNFILVGENGERPLRKVAERLEQFREVFARVFPSTRQTMPAPIVVYVFSSERAYRPFMPLFNGKRVEVAGYFQSTPGAYYITLNTEAGERAYPTIFHEYVHLLVGNALADVPVWFSEGLAEYYETYQLFGEREATLGRVNESHVLNLRERFIPLSELLAVDHRSPLYNEGDRRSIFYAESWALVHYLLIGNPERKGQLGTFLEKFAGGTPSATAVREAFGVNEAALEKELRQYVHQSAYRSNRVRFTDKVAIDRDWRIDQPSDADGQAALADLLLALRRPEDAAARVDAVLEVTPDHARSLAVLARIRAAAGGSDEATGLFERAVKAAPDDYLPAYYQAHLLLRPEGKHAPVVSRDAAIKAMTLLQRVTTLEPGLADAHGMMAYAALVAAVPRAAMEAAAKAFTLSPRHEYALLHARARVHLRDTAARPALTALAQRGSSEWIRAEAVSLLKFLSEVEPAGAARGSAGGGRAAASGGSRDASAPPVPGSAEGELSSRPPPRTIPVFRSLGAGELREIGLFEAVECSRDGIVLKVRTAERVARVSAKAFDQIEFLTYREEPPGQVACGPRPQPDRVYVTYRAGGGVAGADGTVVAIEILPDGFKP